MKKEQLGSSQIVENCVARSHSADGCMVGTSITDIVMSYQYQAARIIEETKGDAFLVVKKALSDMHSKGICSDSDLIILESCFEDALRDLASKRPNKSTLRRITKRYALMLANPSSSEVARSLVELCYSTLKDNSLTPPDKNGGVVAKASATVSGGAAILVWAVAGAAMGGSIGGAAGAVIGAAIGAAIGACDGDTVVTVDSPSGGE